MISPIDAIMVESLPRLSVGRLALRVHEQASKSCPHPVPEPVEIFSLLLQLLQMLFRAECGSTPSKAAAYLKYSPTRRLRRVRKEVHRHIYTSFPSYNEKSLECVTNVILDQAAMSNELEIRKHMEVVSAFLDY